MGEDRKALAEELRRRLGRLGSDYRARICGVCSGEGAYSRAYNLGCGAGFTRLIGPCELCESTGLRQGDAPAPLSVVNQVRSAARRALPLTEDGR